MTIRLHYLLFLEVDFNFLLDRRLTLKGKPKSAWNVDCDPKIEEILVLRIIFIVPKTAHATAIHVDFSYEFFDSICVFTIFESEIDGATLISLILPAHRASEYVICVRVSIEPVC